MSNLILKISAKSGLQTLLNKTRESVTHRNCVIKIILLAPMCDAAYYRHQI